MLTIQCTKKLADYLKKDTLEKPAEEQDKFYAWHAHLFLIQRKKYMVVMNNQTRYNFVLGPLLAKDLKVLDELIIEGINGNLGADGVNPHFVKQYIQHVDRIKYMKTSERSILGQLNDVIFYIECVYENEGKLDLSKLNRSLNDSAMSKLPLVFSRNMMIQEMEKQFS